MVQHEGEPTAGTQHPSHLADGRIDIVDVLEHQAGDHPVERPVGERQHGGAGLGEHRPTGALCRHIDLVRRRIDPDHRHPARRQGARDLPITASEIQDSVGTALLGDSQRDYLILVLRVGPLGEPLDPPGGVLLPETA